LSLSTNYSKDDWKDLTDPYDYLHHSKISLLSEEFYFPHKTDDFDPRPFTVPLFYKLCGSNTDAIVQMQRTALFLSGFFMIAAFMLFIEKSSARYFLMFSVYLLLSWWNVQGWATLVLSEALSMALLFCWLASFLFLYKTDRLPWLLVHAAITFLFAFSRDSWPYVLIAFYSGICVLWFLFKQRGLKKYIALLALCVAIFFVQQASARIGQRSKLPVINSIVVRILPNPDYTRWFIEHGMPDAEKLKKNFDGIDVVPEAGQHRLWALYTDSAYQPFLNWVLQNGQHTYTRFLLTHPDYMFLAHESPAQLSRIMSHDLFYINEPRGFSIYIQPLFPLYNIGVVLVLCIMLLMIYTQRKTPILLAPVFLALFTFLNAIISYNADSLEVQRHLFITNILVQLIGFWAVTLIWDSLVWRSRLKR
jgi:hypothetical protein